MLAAEKKMIKIIALFCLLFTDCVVISFETRHQFLEPKDSVSNIQCDLEIENDTRRSLLLPIPYLFKDYEDKNNKYSDSFAVALNYSNQSKDAPEEKIRIDELLIKDKNGSITALIEDTITVQLKQSKYYGKTVIFAFNGKKEIRGNKVFVSIVADLLDKDGKKVNKIQFEKQYIIKRKTKVVPWLFYNSN